MANDYASDLRDLNEQNWERFKAELHSGLAQQRSELIKWMFVFWSGTMLPLVGLFVAGIALLR